MSRLHAALLGLGILSASFSLNVSAQPVEYNQEHQAALVEDTQLFAFDLYQRLSKQQGNLFFSPISISTAFAMAASGARGDTEKEMMQVLHLTKNAFTAFAPLTKQLVANTQARPSLPILRLANAAWVQKGFELLPSFQTTLQENFGSPIANADFAEEPAKAVETIDQWVLEQTNGKIDHLLTLQDITQNTRLVLVSAVYMKAQWERIFDKHLTQDAPFHVSASKTVNASMMHVTAYFPLFVDENAAVIEVPYVRDPLSGPELKMLIALPSEATSLQQLETELTPQKWGQWMDRMKSQRVHLSIPKFKIETRLDLNAVMQGMGMKLAFSPKADFSGITGHPDLYINKAVHQTFIDVDENGTEAAAATGISFNLTAVREEKEPYQFIADRPFLFLILDKKTESILFMGRFMQP